MNNESLNAVDQELGTEAEIENAPVSLKNRLERKSGKTRLMATMAQMMAFNGMRKRNVLKNGVQREQKPWDDVHLSKEERKGKSYEEMQEMRKVKWGRDETNAPTDKLDLSTGGKE